MINVTKTFLPPIEEYNTHLDRVWKNEWLTNRGPLVNELEVKIAEFLSLRDSRLILMNNGTIPLQIALKILGKGGEIITTPFSYVATTAAIVWQGCKPVFVDIHPKYLTIDEGKIESAITENTTCILATHVFGVPCNIDVIDKIANKYNLKVIYDAAHCFGVKYKGKSIFEFGDISTCSFHATKIFHTGEGGALFTKDEELFNKCFYSHNFGHNGPLDFHGIGINGKISELQAAMGLSVLPYMESIIKSRQKVVKFYLENLNFNFIQRPLLRENMDWNYCYFPILFDTEEMLEKAQTKLNQSDIFPRRYFYPSLNTINYVDNIKLEISENVSKRVLCLPLYSNLSEVYLRQIVGLLNSCSDEL